MKFKTKAEIIKWLNKYKYNIIRYNINEDLTVDVNGDVILYNKNLIEIPIQFNKIVKGNFYCGNNRLTSLEGCPKEVKGNFYCGYNQLTSLKGCPKVVQEGFYCGNNRLTSLEGCPKEVNGDFNCYNNPLTNFNNWTKNIHCFKILKERLEEKELIKLIKKEPEWLEFI